MTLAPISGPIAELQKKLLAMRDDPEVLRKAKESCEAMDRLAKLEAQHAIDKAKSLSIVGARFADRTFANLTVLVTNTKAVMRAKQVALDPKGGIVFYGGVGIGKTHLAGAIAHEHISRGVPTIVDTLDSIFRRARGTFAQGSRMSEEQFLSRLVDVPVLILDDLGKENLSAWSARFFWAVVNGRYECNLPLIATTNLAPERLEAHYLQETPGLESHVMSSLLDRLQEMCGEWVEVSGDSRRKKHETIPY